MDYRLPVSKHDDNICTHIGKAVGQQPGGWSIGHVVDGDEVVLTFPDTVTSKSVSDAVAAYAPPVPSPDTEIAAIAAILAKADADVTAADVKAVALAALRRLRRRGAL